MTVQGAYVERKRQACSVVGASGEEGTAGDSRGHGGCLEQVYSRGCLAQQVGSKGHGGCPEHARSVMQAKAAGERLRGLRRWA